MLVRLTAEGKVTVDSAFEKLLDAEQTFLAGLPEKDRVKLAGLLRTLLSPFAADLLAVTYSSSSEASSHSSSSSSFSVANAVSRALSSPSRS